MRVSLVDLAAQESALIADALVAIAAVARGARFILGPPVEQFEHWLAAASETRHCIGVASGTDAIELALRALGIGAGDAVVTPAFSFVAAAEAIVAAGARPVFCDVDAATLNASEVTVAAALERARRAGLRVRAILPVHLFGRCAPTPALAALAQRENLAMIEDAAQALGARDESGRAAGSAGDAGCFSFFPAKNLGAWGDGGAVVTGRADLAERLRRLRAHGATASYVHAEQGRNSRLDAVQAAILLTKTKHLSSWQAARERLAGTYRDGLERLPLQLPAAPSRGVHAWNAFVIRSSRRDGLGAWLREREIETRVYYPVPLHRQPCFAALAEPSLPAAEEACRSALAIPFYPALRADQQAYVIDSIATFFR
jgi:dTDP-4-amino-4,6-dideoxygalactose transaminase